MKKKIWITPSFQLISSINAKHINAAHEHNYVSAPSPHGHKFYLNTPNRSSFANGIANSLGQYMS